MKKKIFSLLLFPFIGISSVFASLGDELNSLLERVFDPQPEKQLSIPQELDIPEIVLPENPTERDVEEFQKKIQEEETSLETFKKGLEEASQTLWNTQSEKTTAQSQLQQLDQEVSIAVEQLKKLETQSKEWETELASLEKEVSETKTLLRIRDAELQNFLKQNYLREENFNGSHTGNGISVIKWLLSSRKLSDVLEEQRLNTNFVQEKKGKRIELEYLQKELEAKEHNASLLYKHVTDLKENIASEKKILEGLADAKARLIARLEYSEGKAQKEIENYERQRMESEIFLQNLHTALQKVAEQVGIDASELQRFKPEKKVLLSPLEIPLKVTAEFHDSAYEKRFGRTHQGVDFYAPQGTEIVAPLLGTVKKIGENEEGYGYSYMILDHGDEFYTLYGHVSEILVNEGQQVQQGDVIALTGGMPGMKGSGYFTTGPHLHFEVFQNGEHRDPMTIINLQSTIFNEKGDGKVKSSKE